jgi:sodium/potassium-transporting ATPase subunit alpha
MVIMVTGNHPRTAKAIARQIGLAGADNTIVITGEQMRGLSETQLRLTLGTPEVIFARVSADQKGESSQR